MTVTRLEQAFLNKPWAKVRDGVQVKRLATEGDVYELAQSDLQAGTGFQRALEVVAQQAVDVVNAFHRRLGVRTGQDCGAIFGRAARKVHWSARDRKSPSTKMLPPCSRGAFCSGKAMRSPKPPFSIVFCFGNRRS